MTERCETCRWWKVDAEDANEGQCKRFPPVVLMRSIDPELTQDLIPCAHFPQTDYDDFCGEWKAADQDSEPNLTEIPK